MFDEKPSQLSYMYRPLMFVFTIFDFLSAIISPYHPFLIHRLNCVMTANPKDIALIVKVGDGFGQEKQNLIARAVAVQASLKNKCFPYSCTRFG